MRDTITSLFRSFSSKEFLDLTQVPSYIAIGRSYPWPIDALPPVPGITRESQIQTARDLYGAKRINSDDMRVATFRFDWTSGEVYDEYTSYERLDTKKFYVVTDDRNVYKCLGNNKRAPSTVKPNSTSTSVFSTSDGYRWKFMYNIPLVVWNKFATTELLPVQQASVGDGSLQANVQSAAINGSLNSFVILSGGIGYNFASATIEGDGTGASINLNVVDGAIVGYTVLSQGSGYTYANVVITGDGSGAAIKANISPIGGHGSNAVDELLGRYVVISVSMNNTESGKISVANEFRQVVLLREPTKDGQAFGSAIADLSYTLTVADSSTFAVDESITGQISGATAKILEIPSTTQIKVTSVQKEFQAAEAISNGSLGFTTITSITKPDFDALSAKMLFIRNDQPTARNIAQTDVFILPFRV